MNLVLRLDPTKYKYACPQVTRNLVPRPRLYKKLNECLDLPLTMVSAPPGYGKTTLVSAWVKTIEIPVSWITLDDEDNDLQTFLTSLIKNLENINPGSPQDSERLSTPLIFSTLETVLSSVICELEKLPEFVLVLDNYEVIRENQIHELIRCLLRHPISQFHLVLLTRREPPLHISTLRAHSLLGDINQSDLEFTSEETNTFFKMVLDGQYTCGITETITKQMEGWAAGISLSGMSLLKTDGALSQSVGSLYITDYLNAEVLSRISYQSLNLLYRLSIPECLCPDLCNVLLEDPTGIAPHASGFKILKKLGQENLFISPADKESYWYRLHPIFREVLLSQLEEHSTQEEIEQLHASAARWLASHDYYYEALYHVKKVPMKTAVSIFLNIRHKLLDKNNWKLLEQWLALFPEETVETHVELLLAQAILMTIYMRLPETAALLEKIDRLLSSYTFVNAKVRFECKLLQTIYWLRKGEVELALQYSDYAPENDVSASSFLRAVSIAGRIEACRFSGDLPALLAVLREHTVAPGNFFSDQVSCFLMPSVYKHYMISGRLSDVERIAGSMLKLCPDTSNKMLEGYANLYLGVVAYQKNELPLAAGYFEAAIAQVSYMDADSVIAGYTGLAATERALGQADAFMDTIESIKMYLTSINNPDLLEYVELFQMELMLRQGKHLSSNNIQPNNVRLLCSDIIYHQELVLCRLLISRKNQEDTTRVIEILTSMEENARCTGNMFLLTQSKALMALAFDITGDTDNAQRQLTEALSLVEKSGYIRVFLDLGMSMANLLIRSELPFPGIVGRLIEAFSNETPVFPEQTSGIIYEHLTQKELQILGFLRRRYSNKEISDELFITPATVKSHTIRIYQKLNVNGRREAVEKAVKLGILL